MASTTFSLDRVQKSLDEDGFFDLESPEIGGPVWEIDQKNFPFFTEDGLLFCRDHVLNDKRITSILNLFFKERRCILGHWLRYELYPHIVCFRRGGPKAGQKVLMVHLWARGSQVDYYGSSHLQELPTGVGKRSLYEISPPALEKLDLSATEMEFQDGGIVVLDARVCFEIKKGYPIIFGFGTEDVVGGWTKMMLPAREGLPQMVTDMESAQIGLNFAFEGLQ